MRPLFNIDNLIWLGIDARLWPGLRQRFLGGFSGTLGALLLLWWWCFLWECEWVCVLVADDAPPVLSDATLLAAPGVKLCVRRDDISVTQHGQILQFTYQQTLKNKKFYLWNFCNNCHVNETF